MQVRAFASAGVARNCDHLAFFYGQICRGRENFYLIGLCLVLGFLDVLFNCPETPLKMPVYRGKSVGVRDVDGLAEALR